jgi:hypothetical protein
MFIGGLASLGGLGGLTGWGRTARLGYGWQGRKQFGRFACGSTPAFGREVTGVCRDAYPRAAPYSVMGRAVGPLKRGLGRVVMKRSFGLMVMGQA